MCQRRPVPERQEEIPPMGGPLSPRASEEIPPMGGPRRPPGLRGLSRTELGSRCNQRCPDCRKSIHINLSVASVKTLTLLRRTCGMFLPLHGSNKVNFHYFLRQRLFRVKTGATRHAIKDGHHECSTVSSRDCTRAYKIILVLLRASEILLKQGQPEDLYLFMVRRTFLFAVFYDL